MWLRGLTSCIFLKWINHKPLCFFFFKIFFIVMFSISYNCLSLTSWFCNRFYDNNIVVSLWQIYLLNILFRCVIHRMWGEGWNLSSPSAKSITFVGCLVRSLSCLIVMKSFLPLLKLLLETGKYDFFLGTLNSWSCILLSCFCLVTG